MFSNGDASTLNAAAQDFILNVGRTLFLPRMFGAFEGDRRRSISDECGWPESVTADFLHNLFTRDPVARRAVELWPKECWQVFPEIYEDEDPNVKTEFETALEAVAFDLSGRSWHRGTSGAALWELLKRVDILSGIGSYGVVLLGIDDQLELRQPARAKRGRKLLYARALAESQATITHFEGAQNRPRFGMPLAYQVTVGGDLGPGVVQGLAVQTLDVHHSRCVHVLPDNVESSATFGTSRLMPVLNAILDLRKVLGGDAEGFWRGCIQRIYFETHPQAGGDVVMDADALRDAFEQAENGVQRFMALAGMAAKAIPPSVVDVSTHVAAQLEAVSIALGVPKRVFVGSERGELASSQDAEAWARRVGERQRNHVSARVVKPFIDALISLGVLSQSKNGYEIFWPDVTVRSAKEKAELAKLKVDTHSAYIAGNVQQLIPPMEYLTGLHEIPEAEAESILAAASDQEVELAAEGGDEEEE